MVEETVEKEDTSKVRLVPSQGKHLSIDSSRVPVWPKHN